MSNNKVGANNPVFPRVNITSIKSQLMGLIKNIFKKKETKDNEVESNEAQLIPEHLMTRTQLQGIPLDQVKSPPSHNGFRLEDFEVTHAGCWIVWQGAIGVPSFQFTILRDEETEEGRDHQTEASRAHQQ